MYPVNEGLRWVGFNEVLSATGAVVSRQQCTPVRLNDPVDHP
jgi:hypothetical protein